MADRDELLAAFNRTSRPECPSCVEWTTWIVRDWTSRLQPTVKRQDTSADEDPFWDGIEVVVLVCERCGFVRMHSTAVLDGSYPQSRTD
jgi:hypothetical protein